MQIGLCWNFKPWKTLESLIEGFVANSLLIPSFLKYLNLFSILMNIYCMKLLQQVAMLVLGELMLEWKL